MKVADPLFKAIADPTRRKIMDLLAESECSVRDLTASFDVSQPAISQHLRQLRELKLVSSEKVGLEQHYRLTPAPLREVYQWVSQFKQFFDPAGHAWMLTGTAPRPGTQIPRKGGPKHGR